MDQGISVTRRLARQWESPPTWLALFALLAFTMSEVLPLVRPGEALRGVGAAVIAAGLALFALALVQFRRHGRRCCRANSLP